MSLVGNLFVTEGELSGTSPELEERFFDCLRLKNGVYKTTHAHRLDDVNLEVERHLPAVQPLQVLDVAISSGVSTLEWAESLDKANLEYQITGVDMTIGGLLVSFGDRLHAVVDRSRWPLLFEIDGQWLSSPPRKRHLFRHLFSLAIIRSALLLWARRYRETDGGRIERILGMPTRTRAINLVTPRLVNHPRVRISEGNILTESGLQGAFHVIRAANILNRDYFDDGTLTEALGNLRRHLAPHGILVVCGTDTDDQAANHATVFGLNQDDRFQVLSKMNGGSEVEDLILRLPKP
ncbi:MAG TPA: hypothetical protein VKR57_08910 [Terriglobales bacterium]|nr:hypothetical protein [Terriglobales bacterium]